MTAPANAKPAPVLCYVSGQWAYFTTQPLAEQWGDDWDDAPYEHNAGEPYDPCWHRKADARKAGEPLCPCAACVKDWDGDQPKWSITCVAWDGPLEAPCEGHGNSPYSVEAINAGDVAWLRPSRWARDKGAVEIPAGTTLDEFKRLVRLAGGHVYEEVRS